MAVIKLFYTNLCYAWVEWRTRRADTYLNLRNMNGEYRL